MKDYSTEVQDKASRLFDNSFNSLSFELLKKAIGEDEILDYITRPGQEVLEKEAKDNISEEDWDEKTESEKEEAIEEILSEHYPMWSTVFEAKEKYVSDKIMDDIDGLYDLGIGVISPTDETHACLFIAGAGYDFYSAHWIPLLIRWGWITKEDLEPKEEKKEIAREQLRLIDWNAFTDVLVRLKKNTDKTISRHAKGLLSALKL